MDAINLINLLYFVRLIVNWLNYFSCFASTEVFDK